MVSPANGEKAHMCAEWEIASTRTYTGFERENVPTNTASCNMLTHNINWSSSVLFCPEAAHGLKYSVLWWCYSCSSKEALYSLHHHHLGTPIVQTNSPPQIWPALIKAHNNSAVALIIQLEVLNHATATIFLAALTCTVELARLCSASASSRSKDRLFANQWVELSGGMTCLYKLMAPRAAAEHVMVPTNVISHRLNSLSLSLPFSLCDSLTPSLPKEFFTAGCITLASSNPVYFSWIGSSVIPFNQKASGYFYFMTWLSLGIIGLHGKKDALMPYCIQTMCVCLCHIQNKQTQATGWTG